MENKLETILGGIELLVAIGVSTLVGGALVLVKPAKLGIVKKVAVGLGSLAISCMATDEVTNYVDKKFRSTIEQIKENFNFKKEEPETEEN